MIGITDADGDFMRYVVTVQSITLERADGAMVEALPASTTVDLAQFVEVTELLSAATVPVGPYSAAHLQIDYSEADIAVEKNGETVEAVPVDANGDPLGTVDVAVTFDSLQRIVVTPGMPALLAVDFDLAASNTVDLSATPVTVTADPFLFATVNPANGKTVHVGGQLETTDEGDASYHVDLRPFHRETAGFGEVDIHVGDETTYEIDGQAFTGAEGLAQLAALPEGTPTLAEATVDADARQLVATNVLAGSSVPGVELDAVEGLVTHRDGNVLQVRGATLVRELGDVSFREDVEVTLADDVNVHQAGNPEQLDASAISVGQRILAMGDLSTDDPEGSMLDASFVALKETHVSGDVTSVQGGSLVMDLQAVDVRAVSNFDYTGTGSTAETDADPQSYEVATGDLDLENIVEGTPVRIFGFVTPFGAAPPDFQASSVVDVSEASWRMDVRWPEGSTAAFATLESSGIVLDLSDPDLGDVHYVGRGGVRTDLLELPASPTIAPKEEGRGLYGILQDGDVRLFVDFDAFVDALTSRMDGSVTVVRVHAVGDFDESGNSFAAHRIAVHLE